MTTTTQPGLMAQFWLDRLADLARQTPQDVETMGAFIFAVRDNDWPPAGSDLERRVFEVRLSMALACLFGAAATAAQAGTSILVPLAQLLKPLPFTLRESEIDVVREHYERACAEVNLGNAPTTGAQ